MLAELAVQPLPSCGNRAERGREHLLGDLDPVGERSRSFEQRGEDFALLGPQLSPPGGFAGRPAGGATILGARIESLLECLHLRLQAIKRSVGPDHFAERVG